MRERGNRGRINWLGSSLEQIAEIFVRLKYSYLIEIHFIVLNIPDNIMELVELLT